MRTAWVFSLACYTVFLLGYAVQRLRRWRPLGRPEASFGWKVRNFHLMSYGIIDFVLVAGLLVSLWNATL